MRKEEKLDIINAISAQLEETPNFYIADIAGLNAEKTHALRKACFEAGVKLVGRKCRNRSQFINADLVLTT